MNRYTPMELVGLGSRFRQKTKESILAWLLQLWDTGADEIMLNDIELSKKLTLLYASAADENVGSLTN